jgi:hypothetical protein
MAPRSPTARRSQEALPWSPPSAENRTILFLIGPLSRWSEVPRHGASNWKKHLPRGHERSC